MAVRRIRSSQQEDVAKASATIDLASLTVA